MSGQIRADSAIVVNTQSDTGGEPIGEADRVHGKESPGDELAAAGCGLAEHRLNPLIGVVRVAHDAALPDRPPCVLTLLDLSAKLHFVIGAEKRPVLADTRGQRRPFQPAGTESLRA